MTRIGMAAPHHPEAFRRFLGGEDKKSIASHYGVTTVRVHQVIAKHKKILVAYARVLKYDAKQSEVYKLLLSCMYGYTDIFDDHALHHWSDLSDSYIAYIKK